jgi:hypothetical protein
VRSSAIGVRIAAATRQVLARLGPHKRRIGRLVGIIGVLLVSSQVFKGAPRTVQVQIELGPAHSQFKEVRVAYVQAGEELHAVAFAFPNGAPGRLQHSVRLPEGDFEVHTELLPEHGSILDSVYKLHAPSDEPVHIKVPTELK